MSEAKRAWLYRISVALVPLLVAYGLINNSASALWVGLVGALLGTANSGLASIHTSTKSAEPVAPGRSEWTMTNPDEVTYKRDEG